MTDFMLTELVRILDVWMLVLMWDISLHVLMLWI